MANKINPTLGINATGTSTVSSGSSTSNQGNKDPRLSMTGSIFSGSSWGFGACRDAISAAASGTSTGKASDAAAKDAADEATAEGEKTTKNAKEGTVRINAEGIQQRNFFMQGQNANQEVAALTAERDGITTSSSDGTGAGTTSAYHLDFSQEGNGDDSTTGSQSSDNQSKIDDLNAKIGAKAAAGTDANNKANAAAAKLKGDYTAQTTGLKASSAALDGKINDATNRLTDAQQGQQKAGVYSAIGGTTTAAGTALCATVWGKPVGIPLVATGTVTSISSQVYNITEMSAANSAQKEQTDAKAAKSNVAQQGGLLASAYARAIVDTRRSA